MKNNAIAMLLLFGLSFKGLVASHQVPQTEQEEEAQIQEAIRLSRLPTGQLTRSKSPKNLRRASSDHTTAAAADQGTQQTLRRTSPSHQKAHSETDFVDTSSSTAAASAAAASSQAFPDTKKIKITQLFSTFPTSAHASSKATSSLSKTNNDITKISITFDVPDSINNIRRLFTSSYGYKEREIVGNLLRETSMSPAQEYFWQNLKNTPEKINLLHRFMLLNAKAIFYRDLRDTVLETVEWRDPVAQKNITFSEALIDCVGLLYEAFNKKPLPEGLNLAMIGCHFLNVYHGPLEGSKGEKIKSRIDDTESFVFNAIEQALTAANIIFAEHDLPLV